MQYLACVAEVPSAACLKPGSDALHNSFGIPEGHLLQCQNLSRQASQLAESVTIECVSLASQILQVFPGITTSQSDFDGGRDVGKRA